MTLVYRKSVITSQRKDMHMNQGFHTIHMYSPLPRPKAWKSCVYVLTMSDCACIQERKEKVVVPDGQSSSS